MTLPASGSITLGQIAAELGISLPVTLGDSRIVSLAGKSGLPISMGDLYGKSAQTSSPLSLTAQGQDQQYASSTAGGTGTANGTAYPAGGTGPYTYAWSVVSNPGGATVGALNAVSVSISKAYAKLSDGSVTVTFNVTVTDSKGATATVNNVAVIVEWFSNR